jgi:predicted sulfurtransferase
MKLKYKIKKLMVRLSKVKDKKLELDAIQETAVNLIMKMINNKKSNLVYDPEKFRRGIENKEVFVIIHRNKIQFLNGVFNNSISIDDRIFDKLVSRFDAKLTRKFNILENRANQRSIDNLKSMEREFSE